MERLGLLEWGKEHTRVFLAGNEERCIRVCDKGRGVLGCAKGMEWFIPCQCSIDQLQSSST